MEIFDLIFVCTGNTCRSPMAEGIMKELLLDEYNNTKISIPIRVSSAGTCTSAGEPLSEYSVKAAALDNVDISHYRSKPLTKEMAEKADLILTMEPVHTRLLKVSWPKLNDVCELKSFGRKNTLIKYPGIDDPLGKDFEFYIAVYNEIKSEIQRIYKDIFSMALRKSGIYGK